MILSDHFKNTLKAIGAAILLLLGAFFYLKHRIHEVLNPPHVALPTKDVQLITQNENRHTITVTTKKGTTTSYSRNATIAIHKDGTVSISQHPWGLEFQPVLGLGYQDTGRVYLGANWLYFHHFDLFTVMGMPSNSSHVFLEPMSGMSWNVYSNTSLGVGVNWVNIVLHEKPEIGVMLSVRL